MAYVRISIVSPRRGEEEAVERLMRRIAELAASHEGCIESYVLRSNDGSGDFARVSIYTDEAASEHAAMDDLVMAARSELNLAIQGTHTERAFVTL